MATNKPDLTRVWANGAPPANVVDPDTTTPGKFNAGWQAEVPPFEHFNFLQKMFSQGLAHANEQGIMEWDTDTTYPINGLSKGSDGNIYKAVTEQSGNDPVSDGGTNWVAYLSGNNVIANTTDILTSSASLDSYIATHHGVDKIPYSGGIWKFTGTTSVPDAGTEDYDNNVIYDANGRQYSLEGPVRPQQYGAKANGTTNDSVLVQAAMRRDNYHLIGNYALSSTIEIQNNTKGFSENAKFTALTNTFDVVTAPSKRDFTLIGSLEVVGPGGVGTGTGFNFFEATRYEVQSPIVSGLQKGIILDGVTVVPGGLADYRGRQGKWINPTVHNCEKGVQVLRRAEYTLWVNPQVTQCTDVGFTQEAGNTNVIGGNIQDNQNGVLLLDAGSTNANHGMFTTVNINHNIGYNLRCEEVIEGHGFNGCHFYGNSLTNGKIELYRSSGINIVDGIIDAVIEIDGLVTPTATYSGWNKIAGNQINTTFTTINSVNNGREQTMVYDNFQRNGDAWGFNDRALISMSSDTVGGSQTLSSGTIGTIIFNNERDDNRDAYNNANGVFTANQNMNVLIQSALLITISGGSFTEGFTSIYVNGIGHAFSPLVASDSGGTTLLGNLTLSKALQSSDTVDIRVRCVATGTISVSAAVDTNFTIHSTR